MPQGQFKLFNHTAELIAAGKLGDLTGETVKLALVGPMPAVTNADPRFGTGGGTNLSTNEVSGTGYTAGGNECANLTVNRTNGVATVDVDDPDEWAKDDAGPTGIRAGIVYLSSHANKHALGYIDMTTDGTTPVSLRDASLPVQIPSLFTVAVNV
ncbi:hypothetical protein [Motiliproteus sp.]|uniref:hypothetical protein n=1 Tax=Motiliproteus sp. TaxID=1898955 RepID=UPI003BA90AB5